MLDWNIGDRIVKTVPVIENIVCVSGPWVWDLSLFILTVLAVIHEIVKSDYQGTAVAVHLEQIVRTLVGGHDGALLIHLKACTQVVYKFITCTILNISCIAFSCLCVWMFLFCLFHNKLN